MATTNVTPISDDVSSTPPPRRRRWLRRTVVVLLIVGGLFLVLLGITALATLGVRNDLAAGEAGHTGIPEFGAPPAGHPLR